MVTDGRKTQHFMSPRVDLKHLSDSVFLRSGRMQTYTSFYLSQDKRLTSKANTQCSQGISVWNYSLKLIFKRLNETV